MSSKNATDLLKEYVERINEDIHSMVGEDKKILREAKITLNDILKKKEGSQNFEDLHASSLSIFTTIISKFFIGKISEFSKIRHQSGGANFAIAHLFGHSDIEEDPIFAVSKNNIEFSAKSLNLFKDNRVTIALGNEIEEHVPHNRLHVENLQFYTPAKQARGFADKTCAERKIVAHLLKQIKEKGIYDLEGCTLSVYTKLEPCIYCFNMLDSFRKEYGVDIYLIYNEMAKQMKEELEDPNILEEINELLELFES
ncbi:hypothetical protein [Halalkalibacter krulwichiae]|uniref:Uncharacterized protein n=1 Tax=Halalkalibacter krulwichiae TaxID=199441 RepID=A0A1X9M9N2_9BACI|nr:hypothetical protein [Halalkalibacter krulwichiae]ARK30118.1 hypothetical protein BkAM31D_09755 [Halalkalibacter krulwichiae]